MRFSVILPVDLHTSPLTPPSSSRGIQIGRLDRQPRQSMSHKGDNSQRFQSVYPLVEIVPCNPHCLLICPKQVSQSQFEKIPT
jgi:hypothetical protein